MTTRDFDYIIIGAGSAGCVLANRLTASGELRVLMIEAGGRDINPFIHMPAGISKLVGNPRINWDYYTEPEPQLLGRRLYWPRGRVLGGSSSINAMCYIRGDARDYDEWAALGADGWNYESVLPYFRKAQRQARGASRYHGVDGPLGVEDLRYRNPLSSVFLDAAVECGYVLNDDFNGASQAGFGFYQVTQWQARRSSTAVAYLRPAAQRRNLIISTHSQVQRVLIEGERAVGVEFAQRGKMQRVRATREVLLCGGSVASPQLLMCSGIGPVQELEALNIPVRVPASGVGANLQDHLDYCVLQKSTSASTYDFGALREALEGLRYWLTGNGPGASNIAESGGFLRSSRAPDDRADLQFHFVPAQLDDHGRNRLPGHGYTLHACVLRPRSRGRIALRSGSMADPPRIFANYLSEPEDLQGLIEGVRISREILAAASFNPYRDAEVYPGAGRQSDTELAAAIREKAETIYHPVGTCRMGSDPESVVDPQLKVRGIKGLRVVDASVMPRLVGGNTNAPTIMIAERAADLLLDSVAR